MDFSTVQNLNSVAFVAFLQGNDTNYLVCIPYVRKFFCHVLFSMLEKIILLITLGRLSFLRLCCRRSSPLWHILKGWIQFSFFRDFSEKEVKVFLEQTDVSVCRNSNTGRQSYSCLYCLTCFFLLTASNIWSFE